MSMNMLNGTCLYLWLMMLPYNVDWWMPTAHLPRCDLFFFAVSFLHRKPLHSVGVLRSWSPGDSGRIWGSAPWSCFASTWACDSHHSQKCGSMTGKHCQMIGCCSSKVEASTICLVTGGFTWLDGGYPLPWCWACLTRLPQTKLCLLLLAHTQHFNVQIPHGL